MTNVDTAVRTEAREEQREDHEEQDGDDELGDDAGQHDVAAGLEGGDRLASCCNRMHGPKI